MKIQDPNDEEKEIEVFTPEEMAAKDAEIVAAKADAENARRVASEQTANFKKLNEMTEAEKATFTAKEIESMKRIEASEAKAAALEDEINNDKKSRVESKKASEIAKYAGSDPEIKKKLEENYDLINLTGTDDATIEKRAKLAANMLTGATGRTNPLYSPMNGAGPVARESSKTEEFLNSDKAAEARKRMGDDPITKK